jgi:predicted Zn-dependent protease
MVVIMRNYSTTFFLSIYLLIIPLGNLFAQPISSPELGDPYTDVLPLKQEKIIGFSTYKRLQKYNMINNNPLVSSYINYIGNLLARNTLDDQREYTFFVTQSDAINAFAVPGGYIGLNSGLVTLTENEAQLAGVISHEIGHIKLRHTAELVANASMNTLPMWIGIIAGVFSGNPEASIAAVKAGIGFSQQLNINLIRSNEVEADYFAVDIMKKANFKISEMSNFFKRMQSATGEIQRDMAYLSTHPMYENRIAGIEAKAQYQYNMIDKSTDDYLYIRNILEVAQVKDIINAINSINTKSIYDIHKLVLLNLKRSNYRTAKALLLPIYKNNPNNLYLAVLYAEILSETNEIEEAISILNNIKNIYPLNQTISFLMAEIFIENNINLDYAERLLGSINNSYKLNPNYLRILSKMHVLKNNYFKSKIYLSDYHVLLDNTNLAIEVLADGMNSNKINTPQREILKNKKLQIICSYQRPLEPIFGEKTCN